MVGGMVGTRTFSERLHMRPYERIADVHFSLSVSVVCCSDIALALLPLPAKFKTQVQVQVRISGSA